MEMVEIFAYSRAQAIEDGDLIDVSAMAQEANFTAPVAITRALWADIQAIPERFAWQDGDGRLWDVLWMAYCAIRRSQVSGDRLLYELSLPTVDHADSEDMYQVKLISGPGDAGELVITLMKPGED